MVKIFAVSICMDCDFWLLTSCEGGWYDDIFDLWRVKNCNRLFQVWGFFRICFIGWHIESVIFLVEVLCICLGLLLWIDIINESIPVMQFLYNELSSRYVRNILFTTLQWSRSENERSLKLFFLSVNSHRACYQILFVFPSGDLPGLVARNGWLILFAE